MKTSSAPATYPGVVSGSVIVRSLVQPRAPTLSAASSSDGIDLGQRVDHVEGDHREQVQRLHQQHAVQAIDEVDRPGHVEPVVEQHVHRAGPPHDEGEAEHAHQRRRDDRESASGSRTGHARGSRSAPATGRWRSPARSCRPRWPGPAASSSPASAGSTRPGELEEVRQREAARLVGERVVEDPQQGIDEEEDQEQPDGRDSPAPAPGRARRASHGSSAKRSVVRREARRSREGCSRLAPTGSSRGATGRARRP